MDATNRPSQQIINAQKELARRRRAAGITQPVQISEFGVRSSESSAVSSDQCSVFSPQSKVRSLLASVPNSQLTINDSAFRIRISPTLAAHCLNKKHRHNNAALDGPYRLYKILQALDEHGRGWLANN